MIDVEREYGELTRALQGAVLEISPSSPHHINPLDINRGYGAGENPVAMKSELMMSICEQQMGVGQLGAFHKSIYHFVNTPKLRHIKGVYRIAGI